MSAKETMLNVVSSYNFMHFSTLDAQGMPHVRGVDFVADEQENILYFLTMKTSRKVEHLSKNNQIAFCIDKDCSTMEELARVKYIKGTGKAFIVDNPEEMQKAMGLLMAKFPFLSELPGEPSDFVGIRLELENVLVTDNTISFGHTEEIQF